MFVLGLLIGACIGAVVMGIIMTNSISEEEENEELI